ncbi:hypothetical protein CHS0354_042898 [Potamilus streckersoni]|uniref:WD repeat-containing protein 89 n=1 Tax=Potamilus streckersoni TaxID=2493646 RepID=A0AAE0T5J7_9BIVA|nr:hypothetical protein CHS0354_042898 [Potamilus streckersoni]
MAYNVSDLMGKLQLAETSAVSLSKTEDDYVLGMAAQTGNGGECILAATSSNYMIRLFNLANLASKGSIEGHEGVITGVSFGHEEPDLLYSSSLDKTVRCWDTRSDLKKAVQTFEGYEKTNNLFTSFDVNCNDWLLCAGMEAAAHSDTYLLFWDRRKGEVMGYYSESHQDDVTQVSFHPTDPDRMATGSTDGLICIFDLTQSSEDDAILSTLNSQSSVAKIGWIGEKYTNIYCVTHTNTLHVWDAVEGDNVLEMIDIVEQLDKPSRIDYLVDCLPYTSQEVYLVTGTYSGDIRLFEVNGTDKALQELSTLTGGHKSTIRCSIWNQNLQRLITGGEDSLLCMWSPDNQQQAKTQATGKADKLKVKTSISKKAQPY